MLQQRTLTEDDFGQPIEEWKEVDRMYAEIRPVTGTDAVDSQREDSTLNMTITIRPPGYTIDSRIHRFAYGEPPTGLGGIAYGARVFDITGPPSDIFERGRQLELNCIERMSDELPTQLIL